MTKKDKTFEYTEEGSSGLWFMLPLLAIGLAISSLPFWIDRVWPSQTLTPKKRIAPRRIISAPPRLISSTPKPTEKPSGYRFIP